MNPETPTPSNLDDIETRLTALLLGELSGAEAEEVRRAVAADPAGIGYVGMNLLSAPGVRGVAVNGVLLSPLSVEDGRYPYARALRLYTDRRHEPAAVKKFVGLSSALLTFLPLASRFCVVDSISAVDCSESRFWRTAAERTTSFISVPS